MLSFFPMVILNVAKVEVEQMPFGFLFKEMEAIMLPFNERFLNDFEKLLILDVFFQPLLTQISGHVGLGVLSITVSMLAIYVSVQNNTGELIFVNPVSVVNLEQLIFILFGT